MAYITSNRIFALKIIFYYNPLLSLYFTEKLLEFNTLVFRQSLNLKKRVMIIRVGWAFLNAEGIVVLYLSGYPKTTNCSI